ncbi:MAG: DUF885 domain-containing protein [Brevundimonas sp.]|uniref:DUF885 domain-containing protein n=1 Tax=Brevundimonas sp. TaxID=1871086 RepID=UPI00391BBC7F
MTRSIALTGAAVLALAVAAPLSQPAQAQPAPAEAQAQNPALAAILADYEAFDRANDPIGAGREGDTEALAQLPDTSREAEVARVETLRGFAARLGAIDPATLNEDDRLNHAFISWIIDMGVERVDFDGGRLAFDSEGGPGQWIGYLSGATRITNRAEGEAWLSRMEGLGAFYDEAQADARRGLETGLVQTRSVVENALMLAETDAAFTAETDPLLRPLANLPASIPGEVQEGWRARAREIIASEIAPRRTAWAAFLREDYLPAAPETLGLAHRAGGRDYYAFLARSYTTTDMTPDEIHALGQSEVARIRARMDEEMAASGWEGDFAAFLTFLRTDPQFYATSREDLLKEASEMAKRADGGLPALFGTLPRLPYDVRPVPEEIEANYTTGRYFAGSMEAGLPGGYIVNTGRLDQRPLYELPALTLHEAVPGHHLQIALQQEAEAGPYFRRGANVTAFTEGWGLYAEYLGEEMGFYRTPYERFGRLSYEMWRACRLVADTGIHWLGWEIEQARACFAENSALATHNIETELQRYIGWPGQALAYKIGEIRLRDIRARAEAALGEDFDVRAFHDALLVDGPLPLDLLDQRMDAWIAEQAAE